MPELYNITDFANANNPAEMLTVINTWSGGIFGYGLLVTTALIIFMVLKKGASTTTEEALAITSFFNVILCAFLFYLGLVPQMVIIINTLILIFMIGTLYWNKE